MPTDLGERPSEKSRLKRKTSTKERHDVDVPETPSKRRMLAKSTSTPTTTMFASPSQSRPLRASRTESTLNNDVKASPSRSYSSRRNTSTSPSRSLRRKETSLLPESPPKTPAQDLSSIFALISPKTERTLSRYGSKDVSIPRTNRMLSRNGSINSATASLPSTSINRAVTPTLTPLPRQNTPPEPTNEYNHHVTRSQRSLTPTPINVEGMSNGISVVYEPLPDPHSVLEKRKEKTYAGRSRSFLVSLPIASLQSSHALGQSPFGSGARVDEDQDDLDMESYADRELRWGDNTLPSNLNSHLGTSSSFQNPEPVIPLSSISELRTKGESRRFLDELGYLFDGLTPGKTLGVRRSSMLEVVRKLCDVDFMRKAKAADFLGCVWDKIKNAGVGQGGDPVMNLAFCLLAGLIADDAQEMSKLASKDDFVSTLTELLDNQADADISGLIVKGGECLQNAKISRVEKALLSQISEVLREKIDLIKEEGEDLSGSLLMSYTLRNLQPSLDT